MQKVSQTEFRVEKVIKRRGNYNYSFTKVTEIENNIPDNAKAADVKSKTPGITKVATKAILNTKAAEIENKIPDDTGFTTTPEFNKLRKIGFDARMKEATKSLAIKSRVDNALVKADEKRKSTKSFRRLSDFVGKNYFGDNGSQSCLIFQPIHILLQCQLVILKQS